MADKLSLARAPDLVTVILVARLKPGPRLIFHYPASPTSFSPNRKTTRETDSESDSDDADVQKPHAPALQLPHTPQARENDASNNSEPADDSNTRPDTVLGFSEEALQKLLSPGCWCDKKKFEICLDGLTFVGHPVWAAQDGSWSKKHSHDGDASKHPSTPLPKPSVKSPEDQTQVNDGITLARPETLSKPPHDFAHAPESLESPAWGQSFATSMESASSTSAALFPEQLMMFNVVFALNSTQSKQHGQQVSDVYQHVAKTLTKALLFCQKQTQYVGLECKRLLDRKAKARRDRIGNEALSKMMIESSELAWALKEVFNNVSAGDIAGIKLNGMEIALQIPPPRASSLRKPLELGPHTALLLLEERRDLLKELIRHPEASTLAHFVREHTPTKSLQKLATRLSIALDEILNFARHLIKWRKARVIMPLHPRNTYVVACDAPLDQLRSHYIHDYAKRFPLPSLPQVLKILSGKPIPYGLLIRSRDHLAPYMEILAYLVQYQLVEQLKTYGWLQAPTTLVKRPQKVEAEVNENRRPLSVSSLLSPQMRPVRDDDNVSVSSERTAIPVSVVEASKRRLDISPSPYLSPARSGEMVESSRIVVNWRNPSADDSRRLQHIRDTIKDEELRDRLPSLLQYFNGKWPLEEIAANEGLKRAKVEAWLEALHKDSFLVTFRST